MTDPALAEDPGHAVVAAFDFDGTLTRGGSVVPYLVAVRGRGPVAAALLHALPALVCSGLFGGTWADRAKELVFERTLVGVDERRAREVGSAFASGHIARRLRRDASARLAWHRARGHRVVVVSASPALYVEPAAALVGADGALATRLEAQAGALTGRYEGPNCRGAEKYGRVVEWLRAQGLERSTTVLWAYGNSRGDRRLLEAADHGVDAGLLGKLGRLRRYPRLEDVMRSAELER